VLDARDALSRDVALPALRALVFGQPFAWLVEALTRPVIARTLVETARLESLTTVAHGCVPDRGRMDRLLLALDDSLTVLAAPELVEEPLADGDPAAVHLWGRTASAAAAGAYTLTRERASTPDLPAYVELAFQQGIPFAVNDVPMPLDELVESLTVIASQHGVGRLAASAGPSADSAGAGPTAAEAPAAMVLHAAFAALLARRAGPALLARMPATTARCLDALADGGWFDAARREDEAFMTSHQNELTGVVTVKLLNAEHQVVDSSRTARNAGRRAGPVLVSLS
jgi:argininosuccinate synthase